MADWFLEGYFDGDDKLRQLHLVNLPQVVGRDQGLNLSIASPSISRSHAEIKNTGNELAITDLGSSNGTFVNRARIEQPTKLHHGDVIHLGLMEMRVIDKEHSGVISTQIIQDEPTEHTRVMSVASLSNNFPSGIKELERLIESKSVQMMFQPVIDASDMCISGFECLGRGASVELPISPLELFTIAESFNLEVALSQVMRNQGLLDAEKYKLQGDILVNTHPSELSDVESLLEDLHAARKRHPRLPITIEIHEQAVTESKDSILEFSKALKKLKIKLAFDDFGVGQSRLAELVDVQPDLIKFDKALVEKLDHGNESRYNLVKHLRELADDLKIATLAECVGTEGEYKVCEKLGFNYYQGFYFCKPLPPNQFVDKKGMIN